MDMRPIGVFDSGLGGLTAVRSLRQILPEENLIYFGDTARVPYGGRSKETLLKYARQDVRFLRSSDIKAILIACGTVSTTALETLQAENDLPIVGVVFSCIGLIFTLTGGTMLLLRRRQRLLREELERYGIRVTGTVTDVCIDRSYQVNHRSPLRVYITAVHPTTGETVTVRSDAVWETTLAPGAAAEVLFDPADEKKHIVIVDQ